MHGMSTHKIHAGLNGGEDGIRTHESALGHSNGLANPTETPVYTAGTSIKSRPAHISKARWARMTRRHAYLEAARKSAQYDPRSGKPHKSLEEILSKYRVLPNGCHEWTGARNQYGYGLVCLVIDGKTTTIAAHRLQWMRHNGPLPEGIDALHDCPGGDNRACINIDHLWPGDQADNMADMRKKGRQNWRPLFEACPNWTPETRAANIERYCTPAQEPAQTDPLSGDGE